MNSIMKALSENLLQVALVENKTLRTQLAKANERVKEFEELIEISANEWRVKATLKEILEQLRKEQECEQ